MLTAAGLGDLLACRRWPGVRERAGRAGRSSGGTAGPGVVVATDAADVATGREGGFALVIGVDRAGHRDALRHSGADAVAPNLREVAVRTGDRRMAQLPDALQALGLINSLAARRPAVFFDFDGTLSDIVNDPDAATLTPGAGEALLKLAARCPVAVLSGRDLADVTERVGLPSAWCAGGRAFKLAPPAGTPPIDAAAATMPVLEKVADELRDQFRSISGVVVEHKRFGVAVRYRNAARDRVGEVAAAVRAAGQRAALSAAAAQPEVMELGAAMRLGQGKDAALGDGSPAAVRVPGPSYESFSATTSPTGLRRRGIATTALSGGERR